MKTLNELRAFCEGYRLALVVERNFHNDTLKTADDWIVWDEYDQQSAPHCARVV